MFVDAVPGAGRADAARQNPRKFKARELSENIAVAHFVAEVAKTLPRGSYFLKHDIDWPLRRPCASEEDR